MKVKPGIYRHFKGNLYEVLGVGRNSEDSNEESVIYRALYETEFGETSLWYRPKAMFLESVEVDNGEVPRFQYIGKSLKEIQKE